jgi:RNA polymerase sigma-70 factor (ECF subfamily)
MEPSASSTTDPGRPAPAAGIDSAGQPGSLASCTPAERDQLVRLAYRFLWRHDEAEDAVQDALSIAHRRQGDLRDHGAWWSWVRRILVNRCHEKHRERQHEPRSAGGWAEQQAIASDGATSNDAASTDAVSPAHEAAMERPEGGEPSGGSAGLAGAERKDLLRAAIAQLPPRQREVIVLYHLEGLDSTEAAKLLDIAPATVRVHLRDAREALRARLTPHLGNA